jgi:hypothetical protein
VLATSVNCWFSAREKQVVPKRVEANCAAASRIAAARMNASAFAQDVKNFR